MVTTIASMLSVWFALAVVQGKRKSKALVENLHISQPIICISSYLFSYVQKNPGNCTRLEAYASLFSSTQAGKPRIIGTERLTYPKQKISDRDRKQYIGHSEHWDLKQLDKIDQCFAIDGSRTFARVLPTIEKGINISNLKNGKKEIDM